MEGLLASGISAQNLVAVSRDTSGTGAKAVADRGVHVAVGDLDKPQTLQPLLEECPRVYVHALSKDAASADTTEVQRGTALATLLKQAKAQHIIYNGSAGRGSNAGVSQVHTALAPPACHLCHNTKSRLLVADGPEAQY